MEAVVKKVPTARRQTRASQIRLYDILFTLIFFAGVSLLTLLFIVTMA